MRTALLVFLLTASAQRAVSQSPLGPGAIEPLPPVTEMHPRPAASGVSARGDVVAGVALSEDTPLSAASSTGRRPFVWRPDVGYRVIDAPTSSGLIPTAVEAEISADGTSMAGTFRLDAAAAQDSRTHARAFQWTHGEGVGWLTTPDGYQSEAHATSSDGTFVVGEMWSDVLPDKQAVRWARAGERTRIGVLLGHTSSIARDISADGLVVVGTSFPPSGTAGRSAFRWTPEGGTQTLGLLAEAYESSEAYAVSADGRTVVGFAYDGSDLADAVAFSWTSDGNLSILGRWYPRDVSADGETVVGDARGGAVVWTRYAGLRRVRDVVDAEGWWLGSATGVSADGRVLTGDGDTPDGTSTAWRARLRE